MQGYIVDSNGLQFWYVQASTKFTQRSTGQNIYMSLRDIQNIDSRIYGQNLDQALRGQDANCFPQKIGKPFIDEFLEKLDSFLLSEYEE
jgi:hypothetical protein